MDISKAKIKLFASLSARKHRLSNHLFMAQGLKCVLETLPFFDLEALLISPALTQNILSNFNLPKEKIYEVSDKILKQVSSLSNPAEIIAIYHLPQLIVPNINTLSGQLTLALDGIQDPGNLGTIMRTADWFGIKNIIASNDTADIFNPKTIQATMGAIGRVNIAYTNLPEFIRSYKDTTHNPVYGTTLDGKNLYKASLQQNALIIMGNEGRGVSPQVREQFTETLFIPPYPENASTVESLNVAMATAITLSVFRHN